MNFFFQHVSLTVMAKIRGGLTSISRPDRSHRNSAEINYSSPQVESAIDIPFTSTDVRNSKKKNVSI